MCSPKKPKALPAPVEATQIPEPEPIPEPPKIDDEKDRADKTNKKKRQGTRSLRTDLGISKPKTGLNVPK